MKALQAQYPEVRRGRWRPHVLATFLMRSRRDGMPRAFSEMVRDFRMEPDAYVVNSDEGFVHFFEVEVFNPMEDRKLDAYAKLQIDFAAFGVDFQVLVVNKYGHINTVDLLPYYARWLQAA